LTTIFIFGKAFHQSNEAGHHTYLNLFLSDIILPPEFGSDLRIFPAWKLVNITSNSQTQLKLYGIMDYIFGYGKDMEIFDNVMPREINLEGKTDSSNNGLWQCVAQAGSLYKHRADTSMENKKVWVILSDAGM
jgi:hypothetical protein